MVTGWRFAVPFLPCRGGRAAHGRAGAQAARARSPIRRSANRWVKSRIWRLGDALQRSWTSGRSATTADEIRWMVDLYRRW